MERSQRARFSAVFAAFALSMLSVVSGCHSPGPYSHSPNYAPLDAEESATKGAREYDPVMFQRKPDEWHGKEVMLFGIVTARTPGPAGTSQLKLSVRRIEPRNLCGNANDEDTCRVTVSEKDYGVVTALVKISGEDDTGEHSIGAGSLLRVVGLFGQEVDTQDGSPVLRATFYRHFPRNFYVTSASSDLMRQ